MRLIECKHCEEIFEYEGNRVSVLFCPTKNCNQAYHKAKYRREGKTTHIKSERLLARDKYEESLVIDSKWLVRGDIDYTTKVYY